MEITERFVMIQSPDWLRAQVRLDLGKNLEEVTYHAKTMHHVSRHRTIGRATVAVHVVPVVAFLARIKGAIASSLGPGQ